MMRRRGIRPATHTSAMTLDLDHLLKLRVAIARFGEMDCAGWWNTKGQLGALAATTLRRNFRRTYMFAQARSVFAVAAHRSAARYDPPNAVTCGASPRRSKTPSTAAGSTGSTTPPTGFLSSTPSSPSQMQRTSAPTSRACPS